MLQNGQYQGLHTPYKSQEPKQTNKQMLSDLILWGKKMENLTSQNFSVARGQEELMEVFQLQK